MEMKEFETDYRAKLRKASHLQGQAMTVIQSVIAREERPKQSVAICDRLLRYAPRLLRAGQ